jgi:hypothetical protein
MEYLPENLKPNIHLGEVPFSTEEYMRDRFGVQTGRWRGAVVGTISVRSGQKTECPPLNWQPGPLHQ